MRTVAFTKRMKQIFRMMASRGMRGLFFLLLCIGLGGCYEHYVAATTQPDAPLTGLSAPTPVETVEAIATPPLGWKPDPLKKTRNHTHQVWISPSGNTAYGVIHAHMPLPVGPDLALSGFLSNMKRTEGEATLISKQRDEKLDRLRFVVEGGRYRLRAYLVTHDWGCWVVYAGTLRGKPEVTDELALAERAREATIVGLPEKK